MGVRQARRRNRGREREAGSASAPIRDLLDLEHEPHALAVGAPGGVVAVERDADIRRRRPEQAQVRIGIGGPMRGVRRLRHACTKRTLSLRRGEVRPIAETLALARFDRRTRLLSPSQRARPNKKTSSAGRNRYAAATRQSLTRARPTHIMRLPLDDGPASRRLMPTKSSRPAQPGFCATAELISPTARAATFGFCAFQGLPIAARHAVDQQGVIPPCSRPRALAEVARTAYLRRPDPVLPARATPSRSETGRNQGSHKARCVRLGGAMPACTRVNAGRREVCRPGAPATSLPES